MNHQMYVDIVVTAVEGGINYWAGALDYNAEHYPDSIQATIIEFQGMDPKPVELTPELIERGFNLLMSGKVKINSELLHDLHHSVRTQEWEGDAELADCIVQAGVFGDVIYG